MSPYLHISVHGSLLIAVDRHHHRRDRRWPRSTRRCGRRGSGRSSRCPTSVERPMKDENTEPTVVRIRVRAAAGVCLASGWFAGRAHAALTTPQMVDLLKTVDDRQKNNGDWRASAYLEQKEKDKVDVVYETEYYRRSQDQKFMILFTKPKSSAGQGYLRIDKNLWFYDPSVGKWERRTERERIGGTNSRRSDFDESRLAEEYDPDRRGRGEAGRVHRAQAAAQGQAGDRPRVPGDPDLDRQGDQERAQAPGVRAVGQAAADLLLPEVEEGLQRVEEGATSGTRRRSASTTRSRRRTRRWC